MPAVQEARLSILNADRLAAGEIAIFTLPSWPTELWDSRDEIDADPALEPVQLLEGREYRYEFNCPQDSSLTTDRPEVFVPDKADGRSGRLRPGLFTGTLPVEVRTAGSVIGQFRLEVRSHKLDYLRHYRWMLRDVAGTVSELVMERFATSEHRFAPDVNRDPATLYQRFAFLMSVLADEGFQAAMHSILSRPHVSWEQIESARHPSQGWSGGGQASRELTRVGKRVPAPTLGGALQQFGAPASLRILRSESTVDNPSNRFVRFALTRWRELVTAIGERLNGDETSAGRRGLRDVQALANQLDALLSEELFREVGNLTGLPHNDQVLQKRTGYREVLRAYVMCDVAAELAWAGGEDVYAAGQKDVATLYEYWAFLQLAKSVAAVCGETFDWGTLLRISEDGMSIDLKRGTEVRVGGTVTSLGRQLRVELSFNRTFGAQSGSEGSWATQMRPDCSLRICPIVDGQAAAEPVWLHFDAKYRVERLLDIMSAEPTNEASDRELLIPGNATVRGAAKRDDLLKMHAYRDAIRRSAGAYVLYPGSENRSLPEYHELLPGLGAFALSPSPTGDACGVESVRAFLKDVVDHVSLQISQHERGRFWNSRSFSGRPATTSRAEAASFLERPPADTPVLLGYVRDRVHLDWIHQQRLYNLRADDRTGSVGDRKSVV